MSQENVEAIRRGFEAFARGGPEAMVDLWHSEIELWLPSGMIQAGGTYRGRAAVLDWMKEWAAEWEEIDYRPDEFIEAGDTVVVGVLYDGRGKGSGPAQKLAVAQLEHVPEPELYPEKTQALEAAGLSE